MGTPYKMKGSPMARNFGAPFKDDKKKAAQGSMTYPNNDEITAVTEEDKIVQEKISTSNVNNTDIGEKKKLIVQNYMRTGHISDEDNQFLIDNQ